MANRTGSDSQLSVALAISRFKQGQCPSCGKGLGQSRGLEYRPKSNDVYCHTCKRPWPSQMDVSYLEEQVALLLAQQEATPSPAGAGEFAGEPAGAEAATPQQQYAPPLVRLMSGVAALFGSVLKRH